MVLIIVIQAGLKKVDVKRGVFLIDAGVGGMTEPVSHRQGHLGGQSDVEAGSRLGGEVEGMGYGRAVNTFGDDPGAPFDIGPSPRKDEAGKFHHGVKPSSKGFVPSAEAMLAMPSTTNEAPKGPHSLPEP